jgi:VWFA-related protein
LKLLALFLTGLLAAQTPIMESRPTFSTTTNVVVVDVTVLDRNGKPVETLTKDDFLLMENGKPQRLQSCDLERLESRPLPPSNFTPPDIRGSERPLSGAATARVGNAAAQDHRLIVLLFDFSSMQPPEQIRATKAALQFLNTKMTSSDLVSIMTFGTTLKTIQDFTGDRDLLVSTIHRFHAGESSELASMADTGADSEDQSGLFVADETEFNIFNTDRKLAALQDAARRLRDNPQKKALVFLSSGLEKTGVDNQSQLRATVNSAVRANVAFYPIDVRGLVASAPGGDASQSGAVGSKLYSGAGQTSLRASFHNQQETLDSLAADTGGKALLDSNDLSAGISQVQQDIRSYYILTYASSNQAQDGRYRRIQVRLTPALADLKAKLDYRSGYYAPTTFAKTTGADREAQLAQALASENPLTDLPIAVEVDYFRLEKTRYFVPISVKIPGSALAFRKKGTNDATELDFIAQVRDGRGQTSLTVRDTIPLKLDEGTAGHLSHGQVEYDTGGVLSAGKYTLRFVARENSEGKIGTFEMPLTVPDLSAARGLRLSSVVLSNQIQSLSGIAGVKNDKKLLALNPLVSASGKILVPNVTRVFRSTQTLRVYLEVYDPATPQDSSSSSHAPIVAADIAFYQGATKVFETSPIRAASMDRRRSGTVPLQFEVPMTSFQPGEYDCQVDVIDQVARKFAFPRMKFFILPPDKDQ